MPAPLRSSSRLRVPKQSAAATDGLFIVQNEKKRKQLFKKKERRRRKKPGAAAADVLLNTLTPINHWLVSPAIYQQLLPRLGREMANISGVRPNRYLPHSATLC